MSPGHAHAPGRDPGTSAPAGEANDTLEKLAAARDAGDFGAIVGLEKTLAFNPAGHAMHTVFWKNLTPPSSAAANPDGELAAAADEFLGSADDLRAHT
jgi:Fe-Mn family superoxide dismutase